MKSKMYCPLLSRHYPDWVLWISNKLEVPVEVVISILAAVVFMFLIMAIIYVCERWTELNVFWVIIIAGIISVTTLWFTVQLVMPIILVSISCIVAVLITKVPS